MRRALTILATLTIIAGCGGGDQDATTSTTTTTEAVTTTTLAPGDAILLDDPDTGRRVTFTELVALRNMVEVQTGYGTVWLDRDPSLADAAVFADGVAYMIENCINLAAQDLLRTEGIDAVLLVCLEDGGITSN